MARAPSKTTALVKDDPKKRGGALMSPQQRMEQEAEKAANMEKGAGLGKSFSFKGGILSFDGAPIKGNKIPVIVAGAMVEKAYYEGRYDPNNIEPPVCFALDDDPDNLAPIPDDVADLKHEECETCPFNQWGSADTGRGKACKDVRRLYLLPAGQIQKNGDVQLVDDVKSIEKAEFGYAKLPPTSLNAYAAFVRTLSSTMRRPPHGVFAMLEVVADDTNQFQVTWEALDLVPDKLLDAVFKRHDEAMVALKQPYTYPTDEQKAQRNKSNARGRAPAGKPGARKPAGKPAATGRSRAKY